jgi:hypothetical protein
LYSPYRNSINSGYTLAITNSSNPADAAAYFLPTIPLISGARPSCSSCMQHLFEIYYSFSSNSTLGISKNYMQAAQVVDLNCGVGFVSTSYNLVKSAALGIHGKGWSTIWMGFWIGMALWWIF